MLTFWRAFIGVPDTCSNVLLWTAIQEGQKHVSEIIMERSWAFSSGPNVADKYQLGLSQLPGLGSHWLDSVPRGTGMTGTRDRSTLLQAECLSRSRWASSFSQIYY